MRYTIFIEMLDKNTLYGISKHPILLYTSLLLLCMMKTNKVKIKAKYLKFKWRDDKHNYYDCLICGAVLEENQILHHFRYKHPTQWAEARK